MKRLCAPLLALLALLALGACATALPQVLGQSDGSIAVRFDAEKTTTAEADAAAQQRCGAPAQFINQETRYDGFAYRVYRCGGG